LLEREHKRAALQLAYAEVEHYLRRLVTGCCYSFREWLFRSAVANQRGGGGGGGRPPIGSKFVKKPPFTV